KEPAVLSKPRVKRETEEPALVVAGAEVHDPVGDVEERPVTVGVDDPDGAREIRDKEPPGPVIGERERDGHGEPPGDWLEAHSFRGCRFELILIDDLTPAGNRSSRTLKGTRVVKAYSPLHPGH